MEDHTQVAPKILKRLKEIFPEEKESYSPRDSEFRMGLYRYIILSEAYKRNDNIDWFEVFNKIKLLFLQKLTEEEFEKYCENLEIQLKVIYDNKGFVGGYFDLNTRKIVLKISLNLILGLLKGDENFLKNLAANFWVNFVHEDTHRQQQNTAGNFNIFKKYKNPSTLDWNEDLEKDIDYFDQQIEADAYGREIGARLEKIYDQGEGPLDIIKNISINTIKDEYCKKIINIYKDPRISKKVNKSFFRALYDFLEGEEN